MIKPNAKNRNRRLSKKLHVGEFQELGFYYRATYAGNSNSEAAEALIDELLEFVINRGLELSGWVEEGIIGRFQGSANDEDRMAVESWLNARPELTNVKVSPLIDIWYEGEEQAFPVA